MSRLPVFRTGYGVSALASLTLGITMLATKWLAAAALPPEMLFNFTAKLLGVPAIFNFVHSLPFGVDRYAKFVLFGVTVALFLIAWLALGLFYRRLAAGIGNLLSIVLYGIVMVVSVAFILLPIQGLGLFGLSAGNFLYPPLSTHLWAAAFGLVFGIARWALEPRPFTRERREALRGVAHGLLAITLGASLVGLLRTGLARAQELMGFLGSVVGLSPEITPTHDHYVVSKNVFNPSVSERSWNLKITGMVDNELVLTLDDLKALPSVERAKHPDLYLQHGRGQPHRQQCLDWRPACRPARNSQRPEGGERVDPARLRQLQRLLLARGSPARGHHCGLPPKR